MAEQPRAQSAFLGVERSLSGRRWRARLREDRFGLAIAQRYGVPEVVGRILAGRGVSLDEVALTLAPKLKDFLPDPAHLLDMDKAVARLAAAIEAGESVAVFGDYDVDGATSSALLARFFQALGRPLRIYIPDRGREGYGPNGPALLKLAGEGVRLVVTVDCGTTAFAALSAARDVGLDVIVLDHHAAEPALPPVLALVNPNRLDQDSEHGALAAVGVTFLVLVALNRALRQRGFYNAGRPEPNLLHFLDLVALGTVCDVVPLTGLNRALVAQGLKVIRHSHNPGLRALIELAGAPPEVTPYHLGFQLGPRINAGGRVGQADLGATLLTSDDEGLCRQLAQTLDAYNQQRKDIEALVEQAAIAQVESLAASAAGLPPLLVVAAPDWHAGVIGIVAGRLKDRFNRPVIVIAQEGEVGKGSGRSVPGVDLGQAVIAARQAGLLVNGGGHAMAAGLTVAESQRLALTDFLGERIGRQMAGLDPVVHLGLDGVISARGASIDLIEQIEGAGPYGAGFAEPRLAICDVRVVQADIVGADHVRCILAGRDGARVKAIAFRAAGEAHGAALLARSGATFHVAGKLRADYWQGEKRVQLQIDDVALA